MNDNTYYLVTGYYARTRKRFTLTYPSLHHAMCINLWRGSVLEVTDGKRKLLKRVYN